MLFCVNSITIWILC